MTSSAAKDVKKKVTIVPSSSQRYLYSHNLQDKSPLIWSHRTNLTPSSKGTSKKKVISIEDDEDDSYLAVPPSSKK